jgi:hypothetical protein
MKYHRFLMVFAVYILSLQVSAQQRVDPGKMNYLINPKPNAVLYHDTLYKGSSQYRQLFYRTGDKTLIQLYLKHQSNKVWGGIMGVIGTIATASGIIIATSSSSVNNHSERSAGWITVGSGLACTIFGGYLLQEGQRNMAMAVSLFNDRYSKTTLGLGIADKRAGLVINFK